MIWRLRLRCPVNCPLPARPDLVKSSCGCPFWGRCFSTTERLWQAAANEDEPCESNEPGYWDCQVCGIGDQAQKRQLAGHGDDHSQYDQPARQQASKVASNRDSCSKKPEDHRKTNAAKQERHEVENARSHERCRHLGHRKHPRAQAGDCDRSRRGEAAEERDVRSRGAHAEITQSANNCGCVDGQWHCGAEEEERAQFDSEWVRGKEGTCGLGIAEGGNERRAMAQQNRR